MQNSRWKEQHAKEIGHKKACRVTVSACTSLSASCIIRNTFFRVKVSFAFTRLGENADACF